MTIFAIHARWKYALEAIIKGLLLYFLVHDNCLFIHAIIVLDDIHRVAIITLGDTELASIHQYNVGMYSVYSHTCL